MVVRFIHKSGSGNHLFDSLNTGAPNEKILAKSVLEISFSVFSGCFRGF